MPRRGPRHEPDVAESVSREKQNQVAGRFDFACLVRDRAGQGLDRIGIRNLGQLAQTNPDQGKYSCCWDARRYEMTVYEMLGGRRSVCLLLLYLLVLLFFLFFSSLSR